MRVPSHEPYDFHFGKKQGLKEFSSSSSPKNDSQWEEKSKTVGTPEFIEQANRLSDNIVIKATQFQADLEAELKNFGNSIDVEKLQKVANGANSLAGIAHNPTVGFFTLTIFVLIVLSADNYIGFSRIATSVFGAGYTSIEESYREFHVKNNIK